MGKGLVKASHIQKVLGSYREQAELDLKTILNEEREILERMVGGRYVRLPSPHYSSHFFLGWSNRASPGLEDKNGTVNLVRPDWSLNYSDNSLYCFEDMTLQEIYRWMTHWAKSNDFELQGPEPTQRSSELALQVKMEVYRYLHKLHYLCRAPKYQMMQVWLDLEWDVVRRLFSGIPDLEIDSDSRGIEIKKGPITFRVCYDPWGKYIRTYLISEERSLHDLYDSGKLPLETSLEELVFPYVEQFQFEYAREIVEQYAQTG